MQTKQCSRCKETKILTLFGVQKDGPMGRQSHCKSCRVIAARKFYTGVENIELELKKQQNKCGLCEKEITGKANSDHCHATGIFRSILCTNCNVGLGMFKDNKDTLRKAIDYLIKHAYKL